MGNCLTCFKEPNSTASEGNNGGQGSLKEEMPEVRLYPAPSHVVPASSSSAPSSADLLILSNGNHLNNIVLSSHQQQQQSETIATSTTTNNTSGGNLILVGGDSGGGAATSTLSRFYNPAARRIHHHHHHHHQSSKSAPPGVAQGGTTGGSTPGIGHNNNSAIISNMGLSDSKPSDGKLNALFDMYKDAHEDCIMAEGIEQLCKDLQVPPEDFKVLVLAWKLNAEQMCRFTRTEFVQGLKSIRADSIKTVQTRLPELVREVDSNLDQFKDLYRFTFKFGLDSASGQRILPTDMASVLWRLVFTVRQPPILNRWLRFLECHRAIRGIPRDTWNMFLNFSEAVGDDLSCYDDAEAWPSLFDDFVEYENDQANQNISTANSKEKDCNSGGDEDGGLHQQLVIKRDD